MTPAAARAVGPVSVSTRDRRLLYAAAFLRALAIGLLAVVLGLYLAARGLKPGDIGLVVGAGLAGGACASLLTTLGGDRIGRRRLLVALAVASAVGPVVMLWVASLPLVALAAFVGMMNGMGRDRGAALVVEQAVLPATTPDAGRTRAFAWYNLLQDAGHALGGLVAGALAGNAGVGPAAFTPAVLVYSALSLASGALYLGLSAGAVGGVRESGPRLSADSRRVLWRIGGLFALDSVAGGLITGALLAVFFRERFGVDVRTIGLLFFAARLANAGSHLVAAALARRIGLVNTMVFTHAPSSLLLATVPFAPSFPVAAALFLVREGLVEMDVPTRQSYVMAMVRPEERTVASGVTNLVRMGGWALAPALAGAAMEHVASWVPLVTAAAAKVLYDVLLYIAFRHRRPPEERPPPHKPAPLTRA